MSALLNIKKAIKITRTHPVYPEGDKIDFDPSPQSVSMLLSWLCRVESEKQRLCVCDSNQDSD